MLTLFALKKIGYYGIINQGAKDLYNQCTYNYFAFNIFSHESEYSVLKSVFN